MHIIGNWKMNPISLKESLRILNGIGKNLSKIKKTEVVICPPSVYLEKFQKNKIKKISLGAQDAFLGDTGAFTGEVSSYMLYDLGVRYVILGHSERRTLGETDVLINKKIKFALSAGLSPILCVGETVRDESHGYFNLVKNQLEECLSGIKKDSLAKIIIAYEPAWALSSTSPRRDATSLESREMSVFIKKVLSDKFGLESAKIKIIYGGSATEKNAEDFLLNGGVDGLLLGRASLDPKKFIEIVKICEALKK